MSLGAARMKTNQDTVEIRTVLRSGKGRYIVVY